MQVVLGIIRCRLLMTHRFIFDGIGGLIEHLLVFNSRLIRFANDLGIHKMLRNLSALRQNLKTITGLPEDSELSQAQAYYNLFYLGPIVRIIGISYLSMLIKYGRQCLSAYATTRHLVLRSINPC